MKFWKFEKIFSLQTSSHIWRFRSTLSFIRCGSFWCSHFDWWHISCGREQTPWRKHVFQRLWFFKVLYRKIFWLCTSILVPFHCPQYIYRACCLIKQEARLHSVMRSNTGVVGSNPTVCIGVQYVERDSNTQPQCLRCPRPYAPSTGRPLGPAWL